MGTSSSKTNTKIKKLLKRYSDYNVDQIFPQVVQATIKAKKNKAYYNSDSMLPILSTGIQFISSIKSGNYHSDYNFIPEDIFLGTTTPVPDLTIKQITSELIENLDDSYVHNEFLETAFRNTMSQLLLNNNISTLSFISLFLREFTCILITCECYDAIQEANQEIKLEEVNKLSLKYANELINDEFNNNINQYLAHEIDLNKLIEDLVTLITLKVEDFNIE